MTAKSLPQKKSKKAKAAKPPKPRKDYPLWPHDSGQWAKKVLGKLFYFGIWDDPTAAEKLWDETKHDLREGRNRGGSSAGDAVEWLCNVFMDSKQLQHDRGELSKRALGDYHRTCKHVADYFGKERRLDTLASMDFERYRNSFPASWGPVSVNNHLRLVRVLFKYANDIEATDRTIRYQIGLKAVPKSVVRKDQTARPAKEFALAEVHALLQSADTMLTAFILLGINCGYGTLDIARLKRADIDFRKHWLGEPRGKTGVARGCWLWPETVDALRAAIDASPEANRPELAELAFLTRNRRPWAEDGSTNHPLQQAFAKVKKAAGVDRRGVGHYSLRHTFATIAGDTKDQPAVDYIMGHLDQSMRSQYREGIDPERIKAVCQFVREKFIAAKPSPENETSC